MEFTKNTTDMVLAWQNFRSNDAPEKIFEFLNERESLCTPGFLLRRQLQIKFPELVERAAKTSNTKNYADLTSSGNKSWEKDMVNVLSHNLENHDFGSSSLKIEWQQWERYLNDWARCQKKTAIKLIFTLKMDTMTTEKFLLANGLALFSWRNPLEYAYKVCIEYGATFAEAEALFDDFTKERGDNDGTQNGANRVMSGNKDFTQPIKNETKNIFRNAKIPFDRLKSKILQTMLKYKDSFCRDKQDVGYSIQQLQCLHLMLKYLTIMYPKFNSLTRQVLVNKEIRTNSEGTPKTPAHLVDTMLKSQGIGTERIFPEKPLPEYWELKDEEYNGPDIPERGHVREIYHNIPFTRNVLIPLNKLSETLRAILRVTKRPENAQTVDRDTVLILSYFLMTGWHSATKDIKNQIWNTLAQNKATYKKGSTQGLLLNVIGEVFNGLDNIDKNRTPRPIVYVNYLNLVLGIFEFPKFYAPFAIDRFILICLLDMDNNPSESLMSRVIQKSYSLSKEILDESLKQSD